MEEWRWFVNNPRRRQTWQHLCLEPQLHFHRETQTCFLLLSSPGKLLVSAAGKRRSTSSVWKTAWPCWKTKTRRWLKSWRHWRTFTATKPSSGSCLWSRRWRQRRFTAERWKRKKNRIDSGTKTALTVFVSLLTQAWFTPNSRIHEASRGNSNSLSLPVLLSFLSCALFCMLKTQVSPYALCLPLLLRVVRSQPMRASWRRGTGRGNKGASWKCTAQGQRLWERKKKPSMGQPGLATSSKFVWGQMKCTKNK